MLEKIFSEILHWEGMADIEAVTAWLEPPPNTKGHLNALYLVNRETSLASSIGVLAGLDEVTPEGLKGNAYYVILSIVFLASARPFDPVYIPKKYEPFIDAIIEKPNQLRRTLKESNLIGSLANREEIKQAVRFLCDIKILEPLSADEYLIARRPVRKLVLK